MLCVGLVAATVGCGAPPRRAFTPGRQPRHVATHPKPASKSAVEKAAAVESTAPAKCWTPSQAESCGVGWSEARTLDGLITALATNDASAARTIARPAKATELGTIPVTVVNAPDTAAPSAKVEVAVLSRDCLFARLRELIKPAQAAALTAYLADRDAGPSTPGTTDARKKLVTMTATWSKEEPQSAPLALIHALVLDEDLRASGASSREAAQGSLVAFRTARVVSTNNDVVGWWARLLFASTLLEAGEAVEAKSEISSLASRSLSPATPAAIFEVGRIAQLVNEDTRAIAAYRLVRSKRPVDGRLATAAAWRSLVMARAAGHWREVISAAVDLLSLASSGAEIARLVPDARAAAATALDHLGRSALAELGPAPMLDAQAIALEASKLAERRHDFSSAAILADTAGDAAGGRALRARKPEALADRARLELLMTRCFERPRLDKPIDLDVTVVVRGEDDVDALVAPAERAECVRREAPLVFGGLKKPGGFHASVQLR